jgi:hypothetical protein
VRAVRQLIADDAEDVQHAPGDDAYQAGDPEKAEEKSRDGQHIFDSRTPEASCLETQESKATCRKTCRIFQ